MLFAWLGGMYLLIRNFQKRNQTLIEEFRTPETFLLRDITCWTKNYDQFKLRHKISVDPKMTIYDFYACDLLLNKKAFMIVGKGSFFGINKMVKPVIFTSSNNSTLFETKTTLKQIRTVGVNVEIDFFDSDYTNEMTLILRNINDDVRDKIERTTT